ncbi:hypothetical protein EO244_12310 [Ancylomarina salipaludis]|uniref:YncE family protein n=1 Tax=Ancylomarina salipaludis TaxID=2501299 RepID=A0A4Q1JJL9_9BACT|nr:cadherin-like domain-containing protein [Ancylomarina salipaludis]RXQ91526.1 hypothetical protein EO244_12310 [Ancylomarina salipaludis]
MKIKFLSMLALAATLLISCNNDDTNEIPVLDTNQGIMLKNGETKLITEEELKITDSESNPAEIIFTITKAPIHGKLVKITDTETSITIFSQKDIDDKQIQYIHDSSFETSDSFTFTVTDGENIISESEFSISIYSSLSYVINYGSYSGDKSTISVYEENSELLTNRHYETVNTVPMVSNVQYAYNYDGKIFMMGNNLDQIFWVDEVTFKQTQNGITDGIIKPRFCVADGNYLYVSCWGGNIWEDITLSYIAKVNLDTKKVEKKIALEGGPEGLAIVNGKLYAALNYKKSIAVMDLDTEAISYIETQAVSSYFIKDKKDNLYVSQIDSYSNPSTEEGLAYINTTTNAYELYKLEGISSSYVNIMSANDDFSKLYVMTSAYDASWNLSGAIAVFDTATKSFEATNLVEGISGLNGVGFSDDKVFCFVSPSTTANGKLVTYSTNGTLIKEYETGISPLMLLEVK